MEPNLGDYNTVFTNQDVVTALKEGLREAQCMMNSLNMAPSPQAAAKNKVWFEKPWSIELGETQSFAFPASSKPTADEDGDMEVLRENLLVQQEEMQRLGEVHSLSGAAGGHLEEDIDDGMRALTVLESETRDIVADMLNDHEEYVSALPVPVKLEAFVSFDGNWIFKSILVGQLNGNPFLSKDKLTRVKQSLYFNNNENYLNAAQSGNACFVGIGSDVGVFFVQRSTIGKDMM